NADGSVTTLPATLTVTPDHAPLPGDDTVTARAGSSRDVIGVLANDRDPDGDRLAVSAVGRAGHGTVRLVNGQILYTPNRGFGGTDTFTYTVSDGRGATAEARVTVRVPPLPLLSAPAVVYARAGRAALPITAGGTGTVRVSL